MGSKGNIGINNLSFKVQQVVMLFLSRMKTNLTCLVIKDKTPQMLMTP